MDPTSYALLLALVLSKEELRFEFCHEQGYDTSCGLTVAATLLDVYYDIGTDEFELIERVLKDKIEQGDFTISLADMAQALTGYGLACRAYKMDVSALEKALEKGFAPIIVHYDRPETHFALVLSMKDGSVITVDPARGMEALEEAEFLRRYSGIAMLVAGQGKVVNLDRLEQAMGFALGKRDLLEKASRMAGCGW